MNKLLLLFLFVMLECAHAQNDGLPDYNFGTYGSVRFLQGQWDLRNDFAILENNDIISAGSKFGSNSISNATLLKILESGEIDTDFGDNGWARFDSGDTRSEFKTIVIAEDNKILCGGNLNGQGLLSRFYSDGSLDTSFGDNGIMSYGNINNIIDLEILLNGDILIMAESDNGNVYAKLDMSGAFVENFGNSGILSANTIDNFTIFSEPNEIILDHEDNIYDIGFTSNYFQINKYNSSGTLDTDFANNGNLYIDDNALVNISVLVDSKINIITYDESFVLQMREFHLDGTINQEFGVNGTQLIEFPYGGWSTFNDYLDHFRQGDDFLIVYSAMREWEGHIVFYKINSEFQPIESFGGYGDGSDLGFTLLHYREGWEDSWYHSDFDNLHVYLDNQNRILYGSTYHPYQENASYASFVRLNNSNLSTSDIEPAESSMSIYPNPAQEVINIKAKGCIESISFYDINGRILRTVNGDNLAEPIEGNMKVHIDFLPEGIYYLQAKTQDKVLTQKFIVKR